MYWKLLIFTLGRSQVIRSSVACRQSSLLRSYGYDVSSSRGVRYILRSFTRYSKGPLAINKLIKMSISIVRYARVPWHSISQCSRTLSRATTSLKCAGQFTMVGSLLRFISHMRSLIPPRFGNSDSHVSYVYTAQASTIRFWN
jgi:hypothetical protein